MVAQAIVFRGLRRVRCSLSAHTCSLVWYHSALSQQGVMHHGGAGHRFLWPAKSSPC